MIALIILYMFEVIFLGLYKNEIGSSNTIPCLLIIVFSFVYVILVKSSSYFSEYASLLITGYFFRVFLLFFDIFGNSIYILPNSGADSIKYYRNAVWFSEHGELITGGGEFPRLIGTLMKIIGTGRLFSQFTVMLFSIVSIVFFIKTISLFIDIDYLSKHVAIRYLCMLPNYAILSSIFLRESIITMFISISLYFFVKWIMNGMTMNFILAFIFSMIGAVFHSGSVAVAIGYIVTYTLYDRKNQRINIRISNIIMSVVFAVVTIFLYTRYGDVFFAKMENLDDITDIANVSAAGGSSYAKYVGNSDSFGNMAIFTLPRLIYFLFSPFPWQWRGGSDVMAFFFSSFFYALCITKAVKALVKKQRYFDIIFVIVVVTLISTFVFAWGVSNTGTAIRHRDKLIAFYGLLYLLSSNHEDIDNVEGVR